MTTAHGNPEEIENLAQKIERVRGEITNRLNQLHARLEQTDWDDDNFRAYAEMFEEMRSGLLSQLGQLEDDITPEIAQNADALRDYLGGS